MPLLAVAPALSVGVSVQRHFPGELASEFQAAIRASAGSLLDVQLAGATLGGTYTAEALTATDPTSSVPVAPCASVVVLCALVHHQDELAAFVVASLAALSAGGAWLAKLVLAGGATVAGQTTMAMVIGSTAPKPTPSSGGGSVPTGYDVVVDTHTQGGGPGTRYIERDLVGTPLRVTFASWVAGDTLEFDYNFCSRAAGGTPATFISVFPAVSLDGGVTFSSVKPGGAEGEAATPTGPIQVTGLGAVVLPSAPLVQLGFEADGDFRVDGLELMPAALNRQVGCNLRCRRIPQASVFQATPAILDPLP